MEKSWIFIARIPSSATPRITSIDWMRSFAVTGPAETTGKAAGFVTDSSCIDSRSLPPLASGTEVTLVSKMNKNPPHDPEPGPTLVRLRNGYSLDSMRVRVLFFGVLNDLIPAQPGELDLPDGTTVAALLDHYRHHGTNHNAVWSSLAVAVNREYVTESRLLKDGDEVALLPPVSGGAPDPDARVSLVHQRIDAHTTVTGLERPEDGALVIFDGMVRNHSRGRRTLYLVYEAYEEMALTQMRELASRARADFAIRDVAIVHRLGRIEIGESSVLIAVASAHRAAAFDACRWLIDTLKKTVPIWKKEHFEDGAVWADGEPFPAEIAK